jgi:integrase
VGVYRHRWRNGRVSWYCRYITGGVEHREAAGPTKGHAVALLARRIQERQEGRSGVHLRPVGPGPTVAIVVGRYVEQSRARGRRSVERMVRLAAHVTGAPLGDRPAGAVREADLDAYVARRSPDVAPATINRELALVRAALRWAERRGDLPRGCLPHVQLLREPPGRCRVLTVDEETRVLVACPPWLRRLVILAVNTGCREGELLGLRWSAVDLVGMWLHLEQTKSGTRRDVPLNAAAAGVLGGMRRRKPGSLVFPTASRTQISRSNLARAWRAACKAAEVTDCRWHDLRHTAGGRVATATGNLLAVRDLLGHSTITMAQRYGHLAASSVRAAVDAIDPGRRPGVRDETRGSQDRTGKRR